jgi:predicted nucleic acid-binding protein
MIHGLDTGFLVALELAEHSEYTAARATLAGLLAAEDELAVAPQVLAEFMHIATDPKRFAQPLTMDEARDAAEQWWTARDIRQILPDDQAVRQFLAWVHQHSLGRKRLLDTLLAATYRQFGINSLLTTNAADFAVLGGFTCITPAAVP